MPILHFQSILCKILLEKQSHCVITASLPVFLSPNYELYLFFQIRSHMHRIRLSSVLGSSQNSAWSLHSFLGGKKNPQEFRENKAEHFLFSENLS